MQASPNRPRKIIDFVISSITRQPIVGHKTINQRLMDFQRCALALCTSFNLLLICIDLPPFCSNPSRVSRSEKVPSGEYSHSNTKRGKQACRSICMGCTARLRRGGRARLADPTATAWGRGSAELRHLGTCHSAHADFPGPRATSPPRRWGFHLPEKDLEEAGGENVAI